MLSKKDKLHSASKYWGIEVLEGKVDATLYNHATLCSFKTYCENYDLPVIFISTGYKGK